MASAPGGRAAVASSASSLERADQRSWRNTQTKPIVSMRTIAAIPPSLRISGPIPSQSEIIGLSV